MQNSVHNAPRLGEGSGEGWSAVLRGGNAARFGVVVGGVALHAVSIYVVVTIMPVIVGEIGGLAFYAWTATLYLAGSLTGAACVPTLLQRLGARAAFLTALALFGGGSLVCAISPTMGVLLAGRLLQGFGGGMLPALAYGTVRRLFAPALHARAIAALGSVWGIAALIGPALGGLFGQAGLWRAAFGIDLAIGLAVAVAAARVVPAGRDPSFSARDFAGGRVGLLALAAVAIGGGGVTGKPIEALLGVVIAACLVTLVLRLDRRSPGSRLLPLDAYRPGRPLGAVSATMGLLVLSYAPCIFVAYLMRAGHGASPLIGGYAAAALALSWTIAALLVASAQPNRARLAMLMGPAVMLAGVALDGVALSVASPGLVLPGVLAGQGLVGAGIGIAWPHLGALAMAVAAPSEREIAGPFITTTQTLASAFGAALAGMVANLAGLAQAATQPEAARVAAWLFAAGLLLPIAAWAMAAQTLRLTRAAGPGAR